jgi:epoxide hydrolase-like predicted phosphatase
MFCKRHLIKYPLLALFCCIFLYSETLTATPTDVQVVVFDFGGVVAKVNTSQLKNFFTSTVNISDSELSDAFREMQVYVSQGGTESDFWEQYAITHEKNLPLGWFDQFDNIFREAFEEIPETIQIIKELQAQGYKTTLLSDMTEHQAKIICQMGYFDLFHPLFLSYQTGVKKPDPEAFKILLKGLNLPPTHLIFIDDRNENVEAAKKEGIDAIQFSNPEQLKEELKKRGCNLDQNK